MRISNQQIFDQGVEQMVRQQTSVAELQLKIAEGKQLVKPSDNPDKAMVIQRLNSAVEKQAVYESSLNAVAIRLDLEESSISTANDILLRLKEIAVQSSNGTLSADDRGILVSEVTSLRDSLLSLANTQDANDNYIFAGSSSGSAAFIETASGVSYAGDSSRMLIDISDHRQLLLNRPGDEVFASVSRQGPPVEEVGFFEAIDDFIVALGNDNSSAITQGLSDVNALVDAGISAQADVGSRQTLVDRQRDTLADTKMRYEVLLSNEQDLDYATAVTELSAEMMQLEAAQASFAQISQLSLFNYIS